jgi:hypothetical protein
MKLHYGTKLSLTSHDQELIQKMSADICNQDRSYFVNNFKKDKSVKLYNMNLNGFGAELAFCRLCDTEFDSSTNKNESHYNNPDAILNTGLTVDVKNTVYPNGKLIVRTGKEHKRVDLYALVTGTFPHFTFAGWKEYDTIIDKNLIVDLGWGPAYCLPQDKLNKILLHSKL